jgi:predicted ArsR family transcriptional regulator
VQWPARPQERPEARADDEFSAAVAAITAAFGDQTRRRIYLAARDGDGVTAAEIATRFSLHPNVARHHLDKLAAGGYLDVARSSTRLGKGRPSKRYLAHAATPALPMVGSRGDLIVMLLARSLSLLDPCVAEEMAADVGLSYGRLLAGQMSGGSNGSAERSVRSAMSAVADALTAHGFAAHSDSGADGESVVRESCPFGEIALENPVVCAVDRGLVQGLLEGLCRDPVPVRLSSRARGDRACATTALEVSAPPAPA